MTTKGDVFIVSECVAYEGGSILEVFDCLEEAQTYTQLYAQKNGFKLDECEVLSTWRNGCRYLSVNRRPLCIDGVSAFNTPHNCKIGKNARRKKA
jgi:hypothetical protein